MVELIMVLSWKSLLDFFVLFIVYLLFLFPKWKQLDKSKLIINSLMYLYISILLFLTLMPIITSLPTISMSSYEPMYLKPFNDLIYSKGPAEMQIFFNVLMLIPFGFLLPMIKKHNALTVTFTTFLLSLTIEVIQPLLNAHRISDVTDVITNTLGGLIGYFLYRLLKPKFDKYLNKEVNHELTD